MEAAVKFDALTLLGPALFTWFRNLIDPGALAVFTAV